MSPRSLQRVERRRRALVDEVKKDGDATRPRIYRGESSGPAQRYNETALQAINAPIAKYIPLRPYWLVVWFLIGLIPIVALLCLDSVSWQIGRVLSPDLARVFRLSAPGSLMAWCSSVTFAFAVAVMLGTYSVRRFRRDDYRGRFTVWRWAIIFAALISIDTATGLHNVLASLCQLATQTTLWRDGSIWWVGAFAIVFGSMLVRLLFEMSSSRLAVGWACAAGVCYLWSATVELGSAPSFMSHDTAETSKLAVLMLGHHLLLFSLVNYAREVVLEAMGLVDSPAVRRAKADAAKAEKAAQKQATKSVETKSVESPSEDATKSKAKPQKAAKSKPETAASESKSPLRAFIGNREDTESSPDPQPTEPEPAEDKPILSIAGANIEDEGDRKLSKAERRRLRKEQKRQKRAA